MRLLTWDYGNAQDWIKDVNMVLVAAEVTDFDATEFLGALGRTPLQRELNYLPTLDLALPRLIVAAMALQRVRTAIEAPLHITSWARTFERNKQLRGARNSMHLYGVAFDIWSPYATPEEIATVTAKEQMFTGRGEYDTFHHADARCILGRRPSYWDRRTI